MASEEQPNPIYEARTVNIVSGKDGKSTVRIARFLKPCVESVDQAVGIPHTPLLSEIFSHNLQQWPSKVVGWKGPHNDWLHWVKQLTPKYRPIWKQTRIHDAIVSSEYHIWRNRWYVIGLSEFWCPETSTFVFPWGEATVTLEDVMILGGLPVLGEPVTSPLTEELVKIEEEMNKKRIELSRYVSKRGAHFDWMKHYMEKEREFEHVAFLSLWLSRYVFPSPLAEETIDKRVFPIAIHLSRGTPMALAPAVLASLYQSLRVLREQAIASLESINISGPFQLVQLWVWERFLHLAPSYPNSLKPGEPGVARWYKQIRFCNLPDLRSSFRIGYKFQWRPYAGYAWRKWRHLSYYKETEQVLSDCSSLDEELQSFVQCLCASELVGIDCKEKYMPHRVARQFGFDQDLPGDFSGLNFSWENVGLFVPPRTFEPGVSERYSNWWKESKLARDNAIKNILVQERSLEKTEVSPSVQSKRDKDDCHASVALMRKEECQKLTRFPKEFVQEENHDSSTPMLDSRIGVEYSSDEEISSGSILQTRVANRTTAELNILPPVQEEKIGDDCHTLVSLRSLENCQKIPQVSTASYCKESCASFTSNIHEQTYQLSNDEDDLLVSVLLEFRASVANRANPHKTRPCNQSQTVVSPTSSAANENSRKRKFCTTKEGSKETIQPVDGVVEEVKRMNSANDNHYGVAREVKRRTGDSAGNPLDITEVSEKIEKSKATTGSGSGSVEGTAKEGVREKAGESLNNPKGVQKLGRESLEVLEGRIRKLENLLGVTPE